MFVALFHGVPTLVDESDDEEAVEFKKSSIDSRVYLVSINLLGAQDNVVNITSQFSLKYPLSNSSKEVSIHETTWIKPRSYYERSDIFALGKSSCNKFKILRIALLHGPGPAFEFTKPRLYEIYDFTSNSWRVVNEARDWSILGEEHKLCMLASVADDVDIWMATKIDGAGAMSWSKFLTVKRVYNNQWIFLHIVGEDKCIQVDKHDAGSRCSLLLSYVPTLVPASDPTGSL
ncbi:hypothetical protein HID58_067634, partial [Brassica napus]